MVKTGRQMLGETDPVCNIEIWLKKSTINYVLLVLDSRLRATLAPFGETSVFTLAGTVLCVYARIVK